MLAICNAIRDRTLLSFEYEGARRTVEPYAHGSDGWRRALLLAFQVEGGRSTGWRFFHVAKMRAVAPEARACAAHRDEFLRDDPTFSSIHCQR